jgi:D-3-phosphoglycerate dehydrogenase
MKILIPQPVSHMPLLAELLGAEHEIVSAAGTTEADLVAAVGDADGLVATAMDVSAAVLRAGRQLRVVGTPQVGFDRIDVATATELGIPVISAAGAAPDSVAEFALGLMINLSRRLARSDRALRAEAWRARAAFADPQRELGRQLNGSVVGIAGVGSIGIELAQLSTRAFGCRVLGFDPFVDAERMASHGIEKVEDIRDLAAQVDFLVLHVPLTPGTRHIVDAELLARMKPSAFVINVARGGVVDEDALLAALDAGHIAGAALDVFEHEPLAADSPLLRSEALLLTPHIAGVSFESNEARAQAFCERFLSVLEGEQPPGVANPAVWPHYSQRRLELDRGAA